VTANRDVRYDVSRALTSVGISVFHLRRRGEELDEIYRRYFEQQDGGRS
jgi:hypothetical protein